ncbi:uncharacterized protein TNCV_1221011 [Trichonephila clavipes]|nr:uncharacterized protein TNCV_1221011 [Trichonephila clavipes]
MTTSENTPPRKKPNENETGVTLRGREWKSAGRGRKAQKRKSDKKYINICYVGLSSCKKPARNINHGYRWKEATHRYPNVRRRVSETVSAERRKADAASTSNTGIPVLMDVTNEQTIDISIGSATELRILISVEVKQCKIIGVQRTNASEWYLKPIRLVYVEPQPSTSTRIRKRVRLWLEFPNPSMGQLCRVKAKPHVMCKRGVLDLKWTPIVTRAANIPLSGNIKCRRNQFPAVSASAITIHKSQGGTFDDNYFQLR